MLRTLHAWAGAILALLLVLVAATGTALIWKDSFVKWSFSEQAAGLEKSTGNLVMLAEAAEAAFGAENISRIRFGDPSNGISDVQLIDKRAAYMAADGTVLDEWVSNGRVEDWLLDLHHRLLAGTTGLYVVGFTGIATIALVITGWVIWWPTRSQWRQGIMPRGFVRAQLRRSHRNLAMLLSLPIALLFISGIVLTFPDKSRPLFYSMENESYGENFGDGVDLLEGPGEQSWHRVLLRVSKVFPDAKVTGLDWPNYSDDRIVLLRNKGEWAKSGNSRVHVTDFDGMMSMRIDALQLPLGERMFTSMRALHTGGYSGWFYNIFLTFTGTGTMAVGLLGFVSFLRRW